jgi:hypothetical protein
MKGDWTATTPAVYRTRIIAILFRLYLSLYAFHARSMNITGIMTRQFGRTL